MLKNHSKYCYENGVLINKKNIQDAAILDAFSRDVTTFRISQLSYNHTVIKNFFRMEDYLDLHKFLFSDIFPFAGEIRDESIYKSNAPYFVDEYNKTASDEDKAVFYLVDTYYDYNQGIFDDEYVGTSGDVTITSMFCLLAGEGCDGNKSGLLKYSFDCNVEGETKKLTMFEANNGFSTDRGNQAYNLLKSGFDNYEKGYISEDK